jgi:RHS repeat-associated protein
LHGRLERVTYPTFADWSSPLVVSYLYDPFSGGLLSVTEAASSTPLWKSNTRNDEGQVTFESIAVPGGAPVTIATTYHRPTGLVATKALAAGSSPGLLLEEVYNGNGLPASRNVSQAGTTTSSVFDYDNLGRLWSWQTFPGGANVTYSYDSDGNLTQRAWSGETVTYGATASGRTVNVVQGGSTVRTDSYLHDLWGRTYETPTATLSYNIADEVTSLTEKVGSKTHSFIRDGFGGRLATITGNPSTGQWSARHTLDDLCELRNGSAGREELCRVRIGDRLVVELVRTANGAARRANVLLLDNVGSVVAEASTNTGTVSARARRDPFGNLITNVAAPNLAPDPAGTNPDGSSPLAFAGHSRDTGWGLIDMSSRFYSPALGRFVAPDSILPNPFDRREHNAFAYVRNTPTALRDSNGFCGRPEEGACPLPPLPPPPSGPPPSGGGGGGNCDRIDGCVGPSGGEAPPSPPKANINRPTNSAHTYSMSPNSQQTSNDGRNNGWTISNRDDSRTPDWSEVLLNWSIDTYINVPLSLAYGLLGPDSYVPQVEPPGYKPGQERNGRAAEKLLTAASTLWGGVNLIKHAVKPKLAWPPNRGFAGTPTETVVSPGVRLDRFGSEAGTFASPSGTPFPLRSLPADAAERTLYRYEVVKPIPGKLGPAAPAFGQPGSGMQIEFYDSMQWLRDNGYLKLLGK